MEELLTPQEVADRLKIHVQTVRRKCRDGEFEYRKFGHRTIRIYARSIEDYLERHKPSKTKKVPDYEPARINFAELPPAGI